MLQIDTVHRSSLEVLVHIGGSKSGSNRSSLEVLVQIDGFSHLEMVDRSSLWFPIWPKMTCCKPNSYPCGFLFDWRWSWSREGEGCRRWHEGEGAEDVFLVSFLARDGSWCELGWRWRKGMTEIHIAGGGIGGNGRDSRRVVWVGSLERRWLQV
ncbi:hypothetical protein L6452_14807 [Arctium lappa]|uniref:Uncharacterized protein n=1 Tax=Arctium lappa TaxID=4217 RepID=A0ACB9CMJ0_ARCLA|nr:hypothetical protein L6452_14807 [Arctium lappa]